MCGSLYQFAFRTGDKTPRQNLVFDASDAHRSGCDASAFFGAAPDSTPRNDGAPSVWIDSGQRSGPEHHDHAGGRARDREFGAGRRPPSRQAGADSIVGRRKLGDGRSLAPVLRLQCPLVMAVQNAAGMQDFA